MELVVVGAGVGRTGTHSLKIALECPSIQTVIDKRQIADGKREQLSQLIERTVCLGT